MPFVLHEQEDDILTSSSSPTPFSAQLQPQSVSDGRMGGPSDFGTRAGQGIGIFLGVDACEISCGSQRECVWGEVDE